MKEGNGKNNLVETNLICQPPIQPNLYTHHDPHRFDKIQLFDTLNKSTSSYRYQLLIIDRSDLTNQETLSKVTYPVAVFLIPAGRENEYLFQSLNGLKTIASSADCARLIAVSFHRDHEYGDQTTVQRELEKIVQIIAQKGSFMYLKAKDRDWYIKNRATDKVFSIPFLAMQGIGQRNVIAEGDSPSSGPFFVEEVDVDEGKRVRRLYFRSNENVIQTEVYMRNDKENDEVDPWMLAFEYHKHISMGIVALSYSRVDTFFENEHGSKNDNGMIIGLGGGALLNFMQVFFPFMNVTVIELDQSVVQIAKSYFGLKNDLEHKTKIIIDDGLNVSPKYEDSSIIPSAAIVLDLNSYKFIVIDVDSKDNTVGMSCPPVSFVSVEYLTKLNDILHQEGVLAINVSARDPEMLQLVKSNVQSIFGSVFISRENNTDDQSSSGDDLNVVIFCTKKKTSNEPLLPDHDERIKCLKILCDMNGLTNEEIVSDLEDAISVIEYFNESSTTSEKSGKKSKTKGKKKKGKKR